ncbi:MAG: hypothetical protein ACRCYS_15095 [Beijerinckiaceae bacterium]
MTAAFPLRGLQGAQSIITGVNGAAIDWTQFGGGVHMVVAAPGGLAGITTIKLQASPASAADPCVPANTWADMTIPDMCGNGAPTNVQVSIDAASPAYSATGGQVCILPVPCAADFIRPVLSGATAGLSVLFIGNGRNSRL